MLQGECISVILHNKPVTQYNMMSLISSKTLQSFIHDIYNPKQQHKHSKGTELIM